MKTIENLITDIKAIRKSIVAKCKEEMSNVILPNVKKVSTHASIVYSSQLVGASWSAQKYILDTQIDQIIDLMENANNFTKIKGIIAEAKNENAISNKYHPVLLKAILPYLEQYVELHDQLNSVFSNELL